MGCELDCAYRREDLISADSGARRTVCLIYGVHWFVVDDLPVSLPDVEETRAGKQSSLLLETEGKG